MISRKGKQERNATKEPTRKGGHVIIVRVRKHKTLIKSRQKRGTNQTTLCKDSTLGMRRRRTTIGARQTKTQK